MPLDFQLCQAQSATVWIPSTSQASWRVVVFNFLQGQECKKAGDSKSDAIWCWLAWKAWRSICWQGLLPSEQPRDPQPASHFPPELQGFRQTRGNHHESQCPQWDQPRHPLPSPWDCNLCPSWPFSMTLASALRWGGQQHNQPPPPDEPDAPCSFISAPCFAQGVTRHACSFHLLLTSFLWTKTQLWMLLGHHMTSTFSRLTTEKMSWWPESILGAHT